MKIYLKLFAAALFWGGTFIAGKFISGKAHPVSAAFFRFLIASVFLFVAVYISEGKLQRLNKQQLFSLAALGLTGIFSYNLFFFNGLTLIDASRAALIIALNPVAITICSTLIYREPLPLSRVLGIPLSVLGAFFVVSKGDPWMILNGGIGLGELYIFGCVLSWTLYSVIGKTVMHGLTPLASVFWSSLVGTFFLMIPALLWGSFTEVLDFSWSTWLSLCYLGAFGTVIGFFWYFEGIKTIGPSRAAVFINFVPVNGVLLAILLLDEPIDFSLLGGGSLVILGAYLANAPKPLFWRKSSKI